MKENNLRAAHRTHHGLKVSGLMIPVLVLVVIAVFNGALIPTGNTQSSPPGMKTDYGIYPEPPLPPLPPVNSVITDPTFGTQILRATDGNDCVAPGCGTYYSHWPTFNLNNTKLLIRNGHDGLAILKDFDALNFSVGAGRYALPTALQSSNCTNCPPGTYMSPTWESAIWSNLDPNIIYTFPSWYDGGLKLFTYNVQTHLFTLIADLSAAANGTSARFGQMYMSANDDVFSWLQKREGSVRNPWGFTVYKRSTNQILFNVADTYNYNAGHPDYQDGGIDEVHVDKSGKWLHIVIPYRQPDGTGTRFLNLQTGQYQPLTRELHHTPGHGDIGTEIMAGFDNYENGISNRHLSNAYSFQTIFHFRTTANESDWTKDFHGTLLANNEDWMTIGTYLDYDTMAGPNGLPNYGLMTNEIAQIALDGSRRVRRLAHTRSVIAADEAPGQTLSGIAPKPSNGYTAMPKPTISKDGKFIAFTSNWGNSDRYDLFILKIDPAPSLGTAPNGEVNVTWTNTVNASASGNNLTASADSGRGETTQSITSGNGSILHTVSLNANSPGVTRIGLINNAFTGDPTEIDYHWKYWGNGVIYPSINNVAQTNYFLAVNGDTLEVRINGTTIEWVHNNTVLHSAPAQTLAYPYRGVAQMTTSGDAVTNVRMRGVATSFWTNVVNAGASGTSVTATSDNARAETTQSITSGNRGIKSTVVLNNSSYGIVRVGLINGAFTGDATEIDYHWKYWLNGVAYPCINNVAVANYTQTANGDTLEVRINGTNIEWYHNNTIVFTVPSQSFTYPYRGVVQMTTNGDSVTNVSMTGAP